MNISDSNYWISNMRKGNFEEAWKFSDRVLQAGINRDYLNLPRHYQCIWNGNPLNGKRVLVRCYHGLGDTIHFIRYAFLLKEIAKEVIVWAQPSLIPLLKVSGIDRLLPLHDGTPEVTYDEDIEIMELPHYFRTTLETIPQELPYLHVDPIQYSENDLKVGLVWKAGNWDQDRDIPFSLLLPLFTIKGVKIFILQQNAFAAGWHPGQGIHPGEYNLFDYARIIKGLDLLISIDSMPAHLAGAMNVPVWIMLKSMADWRWMEHRTDSLWYPSMKLFRQEQYENWQTIIEKVRVHLQELVSKTLHQTALNPQNRPTTIFTKK